VVDIIDLETNMFYFTRKRINNYICKYFSELGLKIARLEATRRGSPCSLGNTNGWNIYTFFKYKIRN